MTKRDKQEAERGGREGARLLDWVVRFEALTGERESARAESGQSGHRPRGRWFDA